MSRAMNIFLTGLWVATLIMGFYSIGPVLESKFFPVYSKFKLAHINKTTDGVIATFEYTKWRNCDPQGYAWYSGDMGAGTKQLNTQRLVAQPIVPRPLGTNISAPVRIQGISVEEMTHQVFAELYSRCHPLWLTRTVVYP